MIKKAVKKLEQSIAGTWALNSMSTEFVNESPEHHKDANGRLSYNTELKTVFAEISRKDDRQLYGHLKFQYAGDYEIIGPNKIVHHIKWSTKPELVGQSMTREFNAHGNELKIIGKSAQYEGAKVVINWHKVLNSDNTPNF